MGTDFRNLITLDILCHPRTIGDLRSWYDSAMRALNETKESRGYARLGDGAFKIFREEVVPTVWFLAQYPVSPHCIVKFPCDNGPFDAAIFESDGQRLFAGLQIVSAGNGYEGRLRRELVTKAGRAPGFGPIQREKATREIRAEGIAVARDEQVRLICSQVETAVRKKMAKSYPSNTWLIVSVDDPYLSPDIQPVVAAAVSACIPGRFKRAFLVGQSMLAEMT